MMRRRTNPVRLREAMIKVNHARRGRDTRPVLPFETDRFTRRIVRPTLIALMSAALVTGLLVVIDIATPTLPWFALLPLVFLAALEGAYTAAWISNPESHGVDKGAYRTAELFIILVACRLYSWFALGGGIPDRAELQGYLRSPVLFFSSNGFVTTVVIVLVGWALAGWLNRIFNELEIRADELRFYTMTVVEQKAQADNRPIQQSRESLQNLYTQTWLGGGMVLVVFAALSTFEVSQFATVANPIDITRLGLRPAMLVALLIYFVIGFWLQSHARLLRLNALWLSQGMTKDATVDRGWRSASMWLILAIAVLAAFLPIGSSNVPSRIIAAVLNVVMIGVSLVIGFLNLLLASVFALFAQSDSAPSAPLPTLEPLPTPAFMPPAEPVPPNETFAFVASSAFWTLLVMVTIFAVMYFVRERGLTLDRGRARGAWQGLKQWLRRVWLLISGRIASALASARTLLEPSEPSPAAAAAPTRQARRFIRLSALSPRDQIRYFYLSTVRRAGEQGVARQNAETPLEYVTDLRETWPEAGDELEQLTDAFLRARYAPQPIEPGDVNPIKAQWKRVRSALRKSPSTKSPNAE